MTESTQQTQVNVEHRGAIAEWSAIVQAASALTIDASPSLDQFVLIAREHIRTMESSVQSAVGHLQTSMSWSQTVIALGVTAVLAVADPLFKAYALALSMVLIASCSVRSAKNYINVIRFGILHRRSLLLSSAYAARSLNTRSQLNNWAAGIRDYYLTWKSPVSRRTVVRKILFEFHYVYMFVIQIVLATKLWFDNSQTTMPQYILLGGFVLASIEVTYFLRASPYLAGVVLDQDMKSQT